MVEQIAPNADEAEEDPRDVLVLDRLPLVDLHREPPEVHCGGQGDGVGQSAGPPAARRGFRVRTFHPAPGQHGAVLVARPHHPRRLHPVAPLHLLPQGDQEGVPGLLLVGHVLLRRLVALQREAEAEARLRHAGVDAPALPEVLVQVEAPPEQQRRVGRDRRQPGVDVRLRLGAAEHLVEARGGRARRLGPAVVQHAVLCPALVFQHDLLQGVHLLDVRLGEHRGLPGLRAKGHEQRLVGVAERPLGHPVVFCPASVTRPPSSSPGARRATHSRPSDWSSEARLIMKFFCTAGSDLTIQS